MTDQAYINQRIKELQLRLPTWYIYPDGKKTFAARLREKPSLGFVVWIGALYPLTGSAFEEETTTECIAFDFESIDLKANLLSLPITFARFLVGNGKIAEARLILKSLYVP